MATRIDLVDRLTKELRDHALKIEKTYRNILTEDEMTGIVNEMVKKSFETIKQRTNKA